MVTVDERLALHETYSSYMEGGRAGLQLLTKRNLSCPGS
jgi:hypothetical protein